MTRKQRIEDSLRTSFQPTHLEVVNESQQHRNAAGAETHFLVVMTSERLKGLNRLERQRLVNECLKPEFSSGLHALSQRLFTLEEWQANPQFANSPQCAHKK